MLFASGFDFRSYFQAISNFGILCRRLVRFLKTWTRLTAASLNRALFCHVPIISQIFLHGSGLVVSAKFQHVPIICRLPL